MYVLVLPRHKMETLVKLVLLPTGSEERGVLGVESIPVKILPFLSTYKTYCIIIA